MERIVGAGAGYLKSLLSSRKATSGDNREVGSGLSGNYEHLFGISDLAGANRTHPFLELSSTTTTK